MAVAPMAVRLRRTWPQRLLIGINLFLILVLIAAAGGLGYFYVRFGQFPRFDFKGKLDEEAGPAFNVLLVGSDSRDFIRNEKDAASFGEGLVSGQRSDTIMVLRIDPAAKKARVLSIPRDTWVPIAGTGSSNRINTAFSLGGPVKLMETIREALNIKIHHYVQVDFFGFRDIVSVVGGVPYYFPGPARDTVTGLDIARGGCKLLKGDQALALVRSRHYEYYEAGYWHSDPTADFGRIKRQQEFIKRMLRKVVRSVRSNPLRVNGLLDAGKKNLTIDEKFSFGDMLKLANQFKDIDPSKVEMYRLPGDPGRTAGGASVVFIDDEEAAPILAKFRPRPPAAGPAKPAESRVRVLNGNGTAGLATDTYRALQGLGFQVTDAADADSYGYGRTIIRYAPGQGSKAALLATYLYSGADLVEDPNVVSADVELVAGADWQGVSPRPLGKPTAPSSTAKPAEAKPTTTVAPQGADPASQC